MESVRIQLFWNESEIENWTEGEDTGCVGYFGYYRRSHKHSLGSGVLFPLIAAQEKRSHFWEL